MTNTQNLKGIRCPKCDNESAFVVQMTMNVVMNDDGIDFMGVQQPPLDTFPGRVIPEDDGFEDEAPIICFQRPGWFSDTGCGYMGTVGEFRVPEAPSIDDAACREAGWHKASTRHTREVCSLTIEEEANRESEAAFMKRYPGVL